MDKDNNFIIQNIGGVKRITLREDEEDNDRIKIEFTIDAGENEYGIGEYSQSLSVHNLVDDNHLLKFIKTILSAGIKVADQGVINTLHQIAETEEESDE